MAVPSKQEILAFSPLNAGGRESIPPYKRKPFQQLKKDLRTGLIISLTGLRRVGKTTLMKQILSEIGNRFYFSFDEKRYANADALKKVIDAFLEEAENPVIGLDEVFRVDDWAGVIKRYHDQKRARFIVSGSAALMIRKGIESLSGRMLDHYVPPLQFDEYLELQEMRPEPVSIDAPFASRRYETELAGFLKKGSFPEIVNFDDSTAREYIRSSTVERIIFEDIPSVFHIENPAKLYDLFKLCAANSGRLFTEVGFAEATQMSRHTVADYLLYLEKAYLAGILYPLGSFQKALKKQKKIFVKSASIYNALSDLPEPGRAAETAVYDKLGKDGLSFYRDAQKREVDFLAPVPVEVKYQSTITSPDLQNLLYYMEKRKEKKGIVVTKDLFDERTIGGRKIVFIPLDVFLIADVSSLRLRPKNLKSN
jgi:predicted AAA+ superfamily ATPase